MTQYFQYNTGPVNPLMSVPAPVWPDGSPESEYSQRMIRAKRINDENYWPELRAVIDHDCDTLPMERFKVWASVWNVPFMSMAKHSQYIRIALNHISQDPKFAEALVEPMIGCTEQDFQYLSMFSDYPTTMNRIQAVSHLLINGIMPENLAKMDTIVELGAGIGDMADIVYKLGFKGKYIIYDFPEVGRIQKWYHDQLGHTNIVHTSNLDDLVDADLLIATWSFTEMPLDLRAEVLKHVGGTKQWLIAYSNLIFGIDNHKYITEDFVPQFRDTHDIRYMDVPFMPWDGGTKYLSLTPR